MEKRIARGELAAEGFGSWKMRLEFLAALVLLTWGMQADGLGFDLVSSKVKCFSEEISGNLLVVSSLQAGPSSKSAGFWKHLVRAILQNLNPLVVEEIINAMCLERSR